MNIHIQVDIHEVSISNKYSFIININFIIIRHYIAIFYCDSSYRIH